MHTLTPAEPVTLIDAQIAVAHLPPARALAYARLELLTNARITDLPAPALTDTAEFTQMMRSFEEPTRQLLAVVNGVVIRDALRARK